MRTAEPRYSKPDKDIRKEKKYRSTSPMDAKQYDHLINTKRISDTIYQQFMRKKKLFGNQE